MKKTSHVLFALVLGGGLLVLMLNYRWTPMPFPFLGVLVQKILFSGMVLVLMVIGARLPDIIEPGWHKRHRSFFHSRKLALLLTGALVVLVYLYRDLDIWSPLLISLTVGYLSHLLLDAATPGGLPK